MPHHPLYRITHVGRPVEPKYPTNLAILVLMPLAGLVGALSQWYAGASLGMIAAWFLLGGLTVFLTWALGRELAPDDNPAAFIAVALVAPLLVLGVNLDLHAVAVALMLTRVVNRTVGPPAKLSDMMFTLGLVLSLVILRLCWPLALVAALALWWDSRLLDANPRARVFSAVAVVIAMITLSIELGPKPEPESLALCCGDMTWPLVTAGVITALFGLVTAMQPALASKCDIVDWSLSRERVQAGMLTTLLVTIAVTSWHLRADDPSRALMTAPLWLTMAGVVLGRVIGWARGE